MAASSLILTPCARNAATAGTGTDEWEQAVGFMAFAGKIIITAGRALPSTNALPCGTMAPPRRRSGLIPVSPCPEADRLSMCYFMMGDLVILVAEEWTEAQRIEADRTPVAAAAPPPRWTGTETARTGGNAEWLRADSIALQD